MNRRIFRCKPATEGLGDAHEFERPLGAVFARSDLLPFITVIVPVRNEARFIARTIEQLVDQDYPGDRFEILVVDGRSVDETRRDRQVDGRGSSQCRQSSTIPHGLSSAARNIGVRHARGDLIVVVDGHCELEGGITSATWSTRFERSGADCLGRPQPLDVTGASTLQRAIAAARSSLAGSPPRLVHLFGRGAVRSGQERGRGLPPDGLRPGGRVRRAVRRLRGRRAEPPDRPGGPALLLHARGAGSLFPPIEPAAACSTRWPATAGAGSGCCASTPRPSRPAASSRRPGWPGWC